MSSSFKIFLFRFSVIVMLSSTYSALAWSSTGMHEQEQEISVHFNNLSLRQALDEIARQSKRSITYNDKDVDRDTKITYSIEKIKVTAILDHVLKDTGLGHRELNDIIVIYKLPAPVKQEKKGSLEGTLSSAENNEALIGASIRVVGTNLGATTDINGGYIIKDITPGIYEVAVSYIGFETALVRDIKILSGQATRFDYKLKGSQTELQEIDIIGNGSLSGNVVETNEVTMVNDIKTSNLIITGISAQQIARSIDQDAGEVARRLPGVSVLNNFVNIRGMHERYNLTILNDMIAPSSEADRRAFSYDLLPSNMIDKMTVYRSPSPELLGDWAGGVIKVQTKNTSIARQIEINISSWFRDQTTFNDHYTYDGGKRDWLGRDDGTRALPAGFPKVFEIPGTGEGQVNADQRTRDLTRISPEEQAANARWGQKFHDKWNLKRAQAPIDLRAGINYYDSWLLGKMRLNNLTSINTTQATQLINQDFYPLRYYDEQGQLSNSRSYQDTISRKSARWGLLQNLRLRISPHHALEAKVIFNQLGLDETYVRDGVNVIGDFDNGYSTKVFYTYRSRSVLATQLAGSHMFSEKQDHSLNWSVGYSSSSDEVPGQRLLYLQAANSSDRDEKRYVTKGTFLGGAFSIANSFYYSDSEEKNFTGFLDYEKKFSKDFLVKVGLFDERKLRSIDGRLINIGSDANSQFLLNAEGQPVDQYHANEVLGASNFREADEGLFIMDNNYFSGLYNFDGNIVAGYAAVNIPIIPEKLSVYGGVRYERQDLEVVTPYIYKVREDSTVVSRTSPFWLPSVNIKYTISKDLIFRTAYGRTINRPNYREMIPIAVNDPRLELFQIGNSQLRDAAIDNFDARLEWYSSESEFISVGVFYKRLTNAIEPYIETDSKNEFLLFANTDLAQVKGVEAELRHSLDFIPLKWAKYFSTIANVAVLQSEVKFIDSLFTTVPGNFQDFRPKKRQLEGTAKYVINAGLYFEHPAWGTRLSVLYNVLGQRLVYAGTRFFPATYELPRHVIDLTFRQNLSKYIELRAGVQDILNQPRKLYRDYDRNEKFNPDAWNKLPFRDYVFQKYRPGSYYMLGINITL